MSAPWPPPTPQLLPVKVNGAPAILGEAERARAGEPTRFVTRLELDAGGRVREIHTILATAKLTAFYRTPPTEG